jgi:hypothetical protein
VDDFEIDCRGMAIRQSHWECQTVKVSLTLNEIPELLIRRARRQAKDAGTTLEAVLLRFMETYAQFGHPQAAGARAVNATRSAEQRSDAARRAVEARWKRYRKEHPAKTERRA